jgi:hypothetical protein
MGTNADTCPGYTTFTGHWGSEFAVLANRLFVPIPESTTLSSGLLANGGIAGTGSHCESYPMTQPTVMSGYKVPPSEWFGAV